MNITAENPPADGVSRDFHRLSFTGNAKEYFGIWIVNVLLTIVTLGIYSAWAKVRRNRYFYGNTILLGRGFEYHARGGQILIGRLIVFAYIIIYNLLLTFVPPVGIVVAIAFFFIVPWLIMRGLRFGARVTSYRNIHFDFVGKTGGAFLAFMVGPVLATLTIGILTPLASRWMYRYIGNNLRYGGKAFATEPRVGSIYKVWFVSALIVIAGLSIIGGIAFAIASAVIGMTAEMEGSGFSVWHFVIFATYIPLLMIFGLASLFYSAGVRNIAWSSSTFDERHHLLSDLSRRRYAWIVISNLIVTVITLGFMRPWAAVRLARYVNEHTAVRFDGNVGQIVADAQAEGAAVGSEFMDIEGFDFGF